MRAAIAAEYAASGKLRATARKFKTTPRAVRHAASSANAAPGGAARKHRGRPPVVTDAAAEEAMDLLLSGRAHGTEHAAQLLHTAGHTPRMVHRTTVARAAKRVASRAGEPIRVVRGHPAKQLTKATMEARLKFAQSNARRDWRCVMFTDRKRFAFKCPGTPLHAVRWVKRGQRHEAPTVNHSMTLNVYAGVTPHGVTKLHVVSGTSKHISTYTNKKGQVAKNITSAEYKDVMLNTLLPQGQRLMRGGGARTWQLQQDNDPSHRAGIPMIEEWSESHGGRVSLLANWPPNSPDLNLIENLWGTVQRKVDLRGCKTFEDFVSAVEEEWEAVPQEHITNLYASMGKRVAKVLETGGNKTGY